ncbi:caspase-2-like [Pecten maximus]|uniref:caspase-2-like n=1 Tax=Pecten maximus TaxID=6579 RepID=UPI0014583324|nr:caspase-2-like [Pecten maximus]
MKFGSFPVNEDLSCFTCIMDDKWKKNLSDNFSLIVKHVDDPVAIAEYLHYDCNPPVFTEENVQWMKHLDGSIKNKTRRLLNRLTYKPNYPLVALYNAFKETQNTVLRECLVKHVESYYAAQRKDMKVIPPNTLPFKEPDWEEFHKSDVVKCQIDSDALLRTFKDTDNYVYIMTKEIRGRAVILNNLNFKKKKKNRDGSEKDVELLTKTLTQLHFDVNVYQDLSAEDMVKTLEEESQSIDPTSECFILIVMSHGVQNGVQGIDEKEVTFQQLASLFNPAKCPALKDKPKAFLFPVLSERRSKPFIRPEDRSSWG